MNKFEALLMSDEAMIDVCVLLANYWLFLIAKSGDKTVRSTFAMLAKNVRSLQHRYIVLLNYFQGKLIEHLLWLLCIRHSGRLGGQQPGC